MAVSRRDNKKLVDGSSIENKKLKAQWFDKKCVLRYVIKFFICRILFVILLCFIFGLASLSAGEPGTTGANFLKIGVGARPIGMGEAFTAVSGDIYSIYWNPAGLIGIRHPEMTFMYNSHFQDITQQFGAYVLPIRKKRKGSLRNTDMTTERVFGWAFNYLSMKDIDGYDAGGNAIANVKAYDVAGILSYTESLSERISLGSNLKFVSQKLWEEGSRSYALDLGLLYKRNIGKSRLKSDSLNLGLCVQNLGTKVKFIQEEGSLPLTMRLGVAYLKTIYGEPLTISLDGIMPNDNDFYIGMGAEYWIRDLIGLRLGYRTGEDLGSGLRMGIGLNASVLSVDYAFVPYGELGNTHRINLNFKFMPLKGPQYVDESIRKHLRLGERYYESGDLVAAYKEFRNVSDIDPTYPGVRQYQREIEKSIKELAEKRRRDKINRLLAKAKYLYNNGKLIEAKEVFEDILILEPGNNQARDYLKNIDENTKTILKDKVGMFYKSGEIYYKEGKYDKAIEEWEKVLAIETKNAEVKKMIEKTRNMIKAIQKNRAVKSLYEKGKKYYDRKKWEEAIKNFGRLLKIDKKHKDARQYIIKAQRYLSKEYYDKGQRLYEKGRLKESEKLLAKVVRMDPKNRKAKDLLDIVQSKLYQINMEKAEKLYQEGLDAYGNGDLKKAASLLEKVLKFRLEHLKAKKALELIKKELEDKKQ